MNEYDVPVTCGYWLYLPFIANRGFLA